MTSNRNLKILTFNWHEPYICLLAYTGYRIFVVEPDHAGGRRRWDTRMRSVPENVTIVPDNVWEHDLESGAYDLALCHNMTDLPAVASSPIPKILVFHNKLTTSLALGDLEQTPQEYRRSLDPLFEKFPELRFVAISESKKADWDLPATVIPPGIDISTYGGYRGDVPKVLTIGNLLKERDLMMGYSHQEQILRGIPATVLGWNPSIPGSMLSDGFDDLREHYRSHRVYLNTTVDGKEDGYNLAMLEAMATGMPVVSTFNSTSPLTDGKDGYVSNDFNDLHKRIEQLLDDAKLARKLGEAGRRTVAEKFPVDAFVARWRDEIQAAVAKPKPHAPAQQAVSYSKNEPRKILIAYTANPTTTGAYLERALRKRHEVISCGPTISDEVLNMWDMTAVRDKVSPHNIPLSDDLSIGAVVKRLPEEFRPDLFVWVESGVNFMPTDIDRLECLKAAYFIDSHLSLGWQLEWAVHFDFVFVAQREYIPQFEGAGCAHVRWLPLACDPEIHRKYDLPKQYQVGFVGSVTSVNPRRRQLLDRLAAKVDVHVDRCFLSDMAKVLSQSAIVFNNAVKNDLNMRVFEALSCGSLLLTDQAPGSGLDGFFKDGEHLAVYDDDQPAEKALYYLEHEAERERIAAYGRQEVLAKHTYAHRAETLLDEVFRSPLACHTAIASGSYSRRDRLEIVSLVPQNSRRILDVGCAAGEVGRRLKELGFAEVIGVEKDAAAAAVAREVYDEVHTGDIVTVGLPYSDGYFDTIIFADVLEHLVEPETILRTMRRLLADDGTIVVSLPNVRFWGVINNLVEGAWTYTDEGILDRTHLRFFTLQEATKMLEDAGYEIISRSANVSAEYSRTKLGADGTFSFGRVTLTGLSADEFKDLFVFQHIITASKKSDDPLAKAAKLVSRGNVREALEDVEEAKGTMDSLAPEKQAELLALEGNCRAKLQQLDDAERCYCEAIEKSPRYDRAHVGLGATYLLMERFDKAKRAFEEAAAMNSNSDAALCGIGASFWAMGQKKEAMDFFARALDINFENLAALANLVQCAYELDLLPVAEKHLTDYVSYYPAKADMLFVLAGVLFSRGKIGEARERLRTLLIIDPQHQDAQELLEKVGVQ